MNVFRAMAARSRLNVWPGEAAALLAGAAMPLGFAPAGWWWVPVAALALFIRLLLLAPPRRAALRGLLFGLGMFGFGVSWIYNSLHDYGSAAPLVAGLFAAGMVVVNALFPAGVAYLFARWAGGPLGLRLAGFTALWTLSEWVRSWILTGFPWLLIGYGQVDTWLRGYAPLGGVLLVTFVVCLLSALLYLLLAVGRPGARAGAAAVAAGVLAAGYGMSQVEWTRPAGEPLSAVLVQGAIPQDLKMSAGGVEVSTDRYVSLSEPHFGADLMIWPETAVPTFSFRAGPFLDELEARLRREGTELLTGVLVYDFQTRRYYNSLLRLGGDERAVYHKQHLVPFGEYMPFRGLLNFINYYIAIPMSDIAPGEPAPAMPLAGHAAALGICYESAYPEIYRRQLPDAAFMVNVSNDAWFGDSLAPHQHLEIARTRALEAGRPMLRATNDGISAFIGPDGGVLKRGAQFVPQVLQARIQPHRGVTPFIRTGSWPVVLLCALLAGAVFAARSGRGG